MYTVCDLPSSPHTLRVRPLELRPKVEAHQLTVGYICIYVYIYIFIPYSVCALPTPYSTCPPPRSCVPRWRRTS